MSANRIKHLTIDCSLSMHYLGKPSVGIVRTEREIIRQSLNYQNLSHVYFDNNTCLFRKVPKDVVHELVGEKTTLTPQLARERSVLIHIFCESEVYINAGLPWDNDVVRVLFLIKRQTPFLYYQILYDIIPVIMPELCVPGIASEFHKFLLNISWTADVVYSISSSTMCDFDKYLNKFSLKQPDMRRIVLGSDLPTNSSIPPVVHIPGFFNPISLDKVGKYVVYISSIEPRKNHILPFYVWRRLYEEMGDKLPVLVFAGKIQWSSQDFINMLKNSNLYHAGKVIVIEDVSDAEIHYLYKNCLFTIYPSHYEGWGLPLSEARRLGKAFIASNSSSLPEVAKGTGILLDPGDIIGWTEAVRSLINDQGLLKKNEQNIKSLPQPPTWCEAINSFLSSCLK